MRKVQAARNLSDEQTMQLFQTNFEHSLDQLIGAIRNQFQVTEKAMDSSFKQHQADPDVQQAIQNMRVLSANSAAPCTCGRAHARCPRGAARPTSAAAAWQRSRATDRRRPRRPGLAARPDSQR